MAYDPLDHRATDDAFEIRARLGNKQRVRGPYRNRHNAEHELKCLYGTDMSWEIVPVVWRCRCVDEQPDTPESEWEK